MPGSWQDGSKEIVNDDAALQAAGSGDVVGRDCRRGVRVVLVQGGWSGLAATQLYLQEGLANGCCLTLH